MYYKITHCYIDYRIFIEDECHVFGWHLSIHPSIWTNSHLVLRRYKAYKKCKQISNLSHFASDLQCTWKEKVNVGIYDEHVASL